MKRTLCKAYQDFLTAAKNEYKKKNFFDYRYVGALKKALVDELNNKVLEKNPSVSSGAVERAKNARRRVADFLNGEASSADNDDYLRLKSARGKEDTAFMAFANSSLKAIGIYESEVDNASNNPFPRGRFEYFRKACDKLYSSLLKYLADYRAKSKKHHYFKVSEDRAEIANKLMGGSLELWLKNSYGKLDTVGTKFSVNSKNVYECRKATKEEEKKYNDKEIDELGVKNKLLRKMLTNNHIVYEIKKVN